MRFTKMNKDSKGFTLIELLIVIIIIGILAAIAFVAYSGSQNKAHKADAQSTLSQMRSKLGEYNADKGNYPASQSAFKTWLESSDGGNNSGMGAKLASGTGYTYAANDGATPTPGTCDNSTTQCSGYLLTADKSIFNGDTNLTANN